MEEFELKELIRMSWNKKIEYYINNTNIYSNRNNLYNRIRNTNVYFINNISTSSI